jgi:tRNA (guanine37-N1)-methyltransferase
VRLDYLTIFPDYLAPLGLSLTGKAIEQGLVEVHVHDLRSWTHDRHRTVDDTPYGGGAGMVMKPEPWGEAFDALSLESATLVVPTPAGRRFTQPQARDLVSRPRLVFACGRYEGIDQRVLDHAAARSEVVEVSLGDYVLNGGEVAALAITEAVVRLLPGFMGNPESIMEESHEDGLLEHPVYTRPPSWRGLDVPEVLLGGDHAAIAAWRADQSLRRTAERRPDLVHPSRVGEWEIVPAVRSDAGEILTLQRACWVQEALDNDMLDIPALHESIETVEASLDDWAYYVVRVAGRLVGAVRGRLVVHDDETVWDIGRVMVAPDLQGRGLGRALLEHIQAVAPAEASSYVLFTGARSSDNQRMYKKAGFSLRKDLPAPTGAVILTKRRRSRASGSEIRRD